MNINGDYRFLSFDGAYWDDEYMWVSNQLFNGLFKINIKTGKSELVSIFNDEPSWKKGLHHKVFKYNNNLYFFPNQGKAIHVFNLINGTMRAIPLFKDEIEGKYRAADAIKMENKVWIFFSYAKYPVVIFDLENEEMETIDFYSEVYKEFGFNPEKTLFWSSLSVMDGLIYGSVWNEPYLIEFDVEKKNCEIFKIPEIEEINTILYDIDLVWTIDKKNKILISWNKKRGIKNKIVLDFIDANEDFPITNILSEGSKIFLIPNIGKIIYSVNKTSGEIVEFLKMPQDLRRLEDSRNGWRRFYGCKIKDSEIILYPVNSNKMIIINTKDRFICEKSYYLPDSFSDEDYLKILWEEVFSGCADGERKEKEEGIYTLINYIDFVQKHQIKEKTIVEKESNGEKIWTHINKIL